MSLFRRFIAAFIGVLERWSHAGLKTRRALVEARQMAGTLAAIVESDQDGLVAVDQMGKVLIFNEAAEKMLGERPIGPEALFWGDYYQFFEDDEVTPIPREKLTITRALAGEVIIRRPQFVKRPGATKGVHVSVSGSPIRSENSEILGAVASFIDMTALRESQQKLDEQHMMLTYASRMSAVGELAGAIAHEINTPLATIMLVIDTLTDQTKPLPADTRIPMVAQLEMLTRLSERIAKIVQSLRSVSRPGNEDPFSVSPISRIIADTEELCVERLKMLRVSFTIQKDLDFDIELECRPVQIVQVLLNLINNSCYAIKDQEVRWIELKIERIEDFVEFRITDSGAGIPKTLIPKLFTPLFTTKPEGQGSGIGLNISKKIVESHHGTICLNPDHENTQFILRLPILQALKASVAA